MQLDKWRFSRLETTVYKRKSANRISLQHFQHRPSMVPTLKKALKGLKKGTPGGSSLLDLQGVSTGLLGGLFVYLRAKTAA